MAAPTADQGRDLVERLHHAAANVGIGESTSQRLAWCCGLGGTVAGELVAEEPGPRGARDSRMRRLRRSIEGRFQAVGNALALLCWRVANPTREQFLVAAAVVGASAMLTDEEREAIAANLPEIAQLTPRHFLALEAMAHQGNQVRGRRSDDAPPDPQDLEDLEALGLAAGGAATKSGIAVARSLQRVLEKALHMGTETQEIEGGE